MNLAVPPFDDVHVRRAVSYRDRRGGARRSALGAALRSVGTAAARSERTWHPIRSKDGSCERSIRTPTIPRDGPGGDASLRLRPDGGRGATRPVCRNVRALVMGEGVLPEQARRSKPTWPRWGSSSSWIRPVEFGDEVLDPRGSIHDPIARIPMGIAYPWSADLPGGRRLVPGAVRPLGVSGWWNTSLLGAIPASSGSGGIGSPRSRASTIASRRASSVEGGTDPVLGRAGSVPDDRGRSQGAVLVHGRRVVVSERVVGYSFDQFTALPALDRIALAPGSE